MSSAGLSPCPACRSHRLSEGLCPHCDGDAGGAGSRAAALMRLGLKVTATTTMVTTLACMAPLAPQPVAVYGAPSMPMPHPPEPSDGADSQIHDGWSYVEVQSQDAGPEPEPDGETQ